MHRLILLNMPFSDLALPSIALTQLKAVVDQSFFNRIRVEIVYLNQEFAKYFGLPFNEQLTQSFESLNTGLGDWMFRQVAYPHLPDNSDKYFRRYFPADTPENRKLKHWIAQKRPGLDLFLDEMIALYELDRADIVGLTTMFMQNTACFAMARKLKARKPQVITVIGGANCEYPMGRVIAQNVDCIDFVFSGPSLKSFPEFLQKVLGNKLADVSTIRGVFSHTDFATETGPRTIGEDLSIDAYLELDYEPFLSTLENNFPSDEVRPVLPFETSRGCWWGERAHCTFCGLNGASMGYRAMSPPLAIRQFKSLFRHAGRVFKLEAVDNILPKSYLKEVLPQLETPHDMMIFYEVKADLSEEDIATLARARVNRIQPGIESLATSTLKLMKKGTTAFQNVALLKRCALYDIHPAWNLLVGFPGEAEPVYQRYLEILPLLHHLPPPSGAYTVRFDRFSPYYDQAQAYGLDLHPLDFYSYIYPFGESDIKDFAYYFADRNINAEYFTTVARWIGKLQTKVNDWRALWGSSRTGGPPELFFQGNSTIVRDSRHGPVLHHDVGRVGKLLLNFLEKPGRIGETLKLFKDLHGIDAANEIKQLESDGLIFREDDRLLSLVLQGKHGSSRRMLLEQSNKATLTV